jgi:hypothetical protein
LIFFCTPLHSSIPFLLHCSFYHHCYREVLFANFQQNHKDGVTDVTLVRHQLAREFKLCGLLCGTPAPCQSGKAEMYSDLTHQIIQMVLMNLAEREGSTHFNALNGTDSKLSHIYACNFLGSLFIYRWGSI